MRARILLQLAALCLAISAVCAQQGGDAGFTQIFNGRDLTGWDGNPKLWSVQNGVIRGKTSLSHLAFSNTFLIWKGGEVKDFELKIKFRIHSGNSGVQYRSKDLGKHVVAGYQAEIENHPGKVGFLYEEKGRKSLAHVGEKVQIDATGNRQVSGLIMPGESYIQQEYYRSRDWNEYHIIARGNYVTHYLNGFQTIELLDHSPAARSQGVLALQIHAGPPMLVEFKDIFLKKL